MTRTDLQEPAAHPVAPGPVRSGVARERVTVIEPRAGLGGLGLAEIAERRGLLLALVLRDTRTRYKQTALGILWAWIRPVATLVVLTLVFDRLAGLPSEGTPYPLFAFAGLLAWGFIATSVATASLSVVHAAPLITKVWFPRVLLPLSAVGAATLDFLLALPILVPLMAVHGADPAWRMLLAPLVMLWCALAAVGAGTLLAALVARWRDFQHVTPFLLQIGLLATPVAWPASAVPTGWREALYVNPMAGPVEAMRAALLGTPTSPSGLLLSGGVGLATLVAGLYAFRHLERRLADVV